jgi:ATP-binding protein involved in chromosome partitioning
VSSPQSQPIELNLKRSTHLEIQWADGHRSVIPVLQLRKACPCAACRAAREERERNPLAVSQPVRDPHDMVTVDRAELVGNYGLRIRWKDGHGAGIYDFGLLRSLG